MINIHATDELTLAERAETDARLGYAMDDAAIIEQIAENFRDHLLIALSEARASSLKMESDVRDRLMDDLSKQFHPDANASDLFSDAFSTARRMASDRVELVAAE